MSSELSRFKYKDWTIAHIDDKGQLICNGDFIKWVESLETQLEAKSRWISVKAKLPERFQPVAFVVKSEDEKYHRKVYGGQYQGMMFKGEEFEYPGFSIPGIEFEGSHWYSLLPPPPETNRHG
jgi:hypothetical protein